MKAAVCPRYGPPEVVRLAEVPTPGLAEREVLIRVHATTVNRTDCGIRACHPWFARFFTGITRPKVPVLGSEFAGVVEALGSGVTSFRVGDRVFGSTATGFGAHAEVLTIAEDGPLAPMPEGPTFEEVVPSTEGAHYALTNIQGARIRAGQNVLVNGGTGGIGSAAVQILKSMGANVTAVCDGEHADLVRGLGAERIIDFTTEDFTKDRQRYDVVFDAVGKSSFGRCRRLLEPHGVYLSTDLGPLSMNPVLGLVTPVIGRRKARMLIPSRLDQRGVMRLRDMIESGAFKPVIDRRYPLDQIVEAYRYVESGRKIGNVVIDVAPPSGEVGT